MPLKTDIIIAVKRSELMVEVQLEYFDYTKVICTSVASPRKSGSISPLIAEKFSRREYTA